MSTVVPAPGQRPSSVRVDSILRAACRVVVREGAHGLRMATVAAEAGVSKALVHYYFTTRQELLRSAFAFADRHLNEAIEADLALLATGRERLERVLVAGVEAGPPYSDQRSLYNEVWSGLRYDDELRPLVVECYAASIDRLVALIEEGQADGSIPASIEARPAGMRLTAAADGLDSMLYLGLVDNDAAAALAAAVLERELTV
jgi:AcrR family transcriptional regulator